MLWPTYDTSPPEYVGQNKSHGSSKLGECGEGKTPFRMPRRTGELDIVSSRY